MARQNQNNACPGMCTRSRNPRRLQTAAMLGSVTVLFFACAPKASDAEIEQMCDRLLILRNEAGNRTMKAECIETAKAEGVSARQARCRISAVNTQEYWNRCRTGEARNP